MITRQWPWHGGLQGWFWPASTAHTWWVKKTEDGQFYTMRRTDTSQIPRGPYLKTKEEAFIQAVALEIGDLRKRGLLKRAEHFLRATGADVDKVLVKLDQLYDIRALNNPKGIRHYPWLKLKYTEPFIPLMKKRGAAKVARSYRGFYTAFKDAGGKPGKMGKTHPDTPNRDPYPWWKRRNEFISRHMAQVKKNNESLWDSSGNPTNRHLGLIAWAYTPEPEKVWQWVQSRSAKKNSSRWRHPEDEMLWADWGGPALAQDRWLHHPARFALAELLRVQADEPSQVIRRWEVVPEDVLPVLINIGKRQPTWFFFDLGPLSVFEAWLELGSPPSPTRKKMHRLLKKRNKEIKAASARGPQVMHPGSQKTVRPDESTQYTLLQREDEYREVAERFDNCLHWNYWYGREKEDMRRVRVYWSKKNDHLISFESGDPEPLDAETLHARKDALAEGRKLGIYLQENSWPNPQGARRNGGWSRNDSFGLMRYMLELPFGMSFLVRNSYDEESHWLPVFRGPRHYRRAFIGAAASRGFKAKEGALDVMSVFASTQSTPEQAQQLLLDLYLVMPSYLPKKKAQEVLNTFSSEMLVRRDWLLSQGA